MPWRGAEYEGEFPSLGWQVLDWAESSFVVPDGPFAGDPLVLTDEQSAILVRWFQVDDRGRFVFRRASARRAQGWENRLCSRSPRSRSCAARSVSTAGMPRASRLALLRRRRGCRSLR